MTDFNMNAKLPGLNAINGFVRENLVQPLQNNQKAESKSEVKVEKRQEVATDSSLSAQAKINAEKELPKELSHEKMDDTIRQLNDSLQNVQRNLEFSIDKDAGRIVINVKDKVTDEIVRQIPSEEVLELARNLHDVSVNLNQNSSERSTSYASQSSAEGVFLKTSV